MSKNGKHDIMSWFSKKEEKTSLQLEMEDYSRVSDYIKLSIVKDWLVGKVIDPKSDLGQLFGTTVNFLLADPSEFPPTATREEIAKVKRAIYLMALEILGENPTLNALMVQHMKRKAHINHKIYGKDGLRYDLKEDFGSARKVNDVLKICGTELREVTFDWKEYTRLLREYASQRGEERIFTPQADK